MTDRSASAHASIDKVVRDIRELHNSFELLIQEFRIIIDKLNNTKKSEKTKLSSSYWIRVAYLDALIKMRIFIEQNFQFIETMGLLAVTRYAFELTVWLQLMQHDHRYGLVYFSELLKNQQSLYMDMKAHLIKEAAFFEDLDKSESSLLKQEVMAAQTIVNQGKRHDALKKLGKNVQREVDDQASRRFALYVEDAKTNGYGYQAHLIRTKVVPSAQTAIDGLEKELRELETSMPKDVQRLARARWNWKQHAKIVNMDDEYDFIYSYTSRLLHATPASLTTDQKNLEHLEVLVFLRYIYFRLRTARELAQSLLSTGTTLH
jgi:hypothetical protein